MESQTNFECLHANVEGRVQGVGFRYFVLTQARELNLVGWVRNTYHGQVEVTAEGPRKQLELLLNYLRRGPSSSFVQEVNFDYGPASGKFASFEVVSTI